jgi:hypothetical protein
MSVHASHEALTLHSPVAHPGSPWLTLAHPVVDSPGEVTCRPTFLSVEGSNIETVDSMAMESLLIPVDYSIVAVNLHHAMIVGDGEGKDLSIKLLHTRRYSLLVVRVVDQRDHTI